MGNKKKAQQYMTLLEEDQCKCASVSSAVTVRPLLDDDTALFISFCF